MIEEVFPHKATLLVHEFGKTKTSTVHLTEELHNEVLMLEAAHGIPVDSNDLPEGTKRLWIERVEDHYAEGRYKGKMAYRLKREDFLNGLLIAEEPPAPKESIVKELKLSEKSAEEQINEVVDTIYDMLNRLITDEEVKHDRVISILERIKFEYIVAARENE